MSPENILPVKKATKLNVIFHSALRTRPSTFQIRLGFLPQLLIQCLGENKSLCPTCLPFLIPMLWELSPTWLLHLKPSEFDIPQLCHPTNVSVKKIT